MTVLARLLITVLLLLALPMQGLAAAGRLHCGASGGPAPHAHAAGEPAHAGEHAHAGHAHADASAAHAAAADGPVPDPHGGCSACALCCHALALPAPEWRLGEAPPAPPATLRAVGPLPPFLTGGPERPPRVRLG